MRTHNWKSLMPFRKQLRSNGTKAEAILWIGLKNKQLEGRKFRRQQSIGNYIVDFYCPSEQLVIELDGEGHFSPSSEQYDWERAQYFNRLGIFVLRYENYIVIKYPEMVVEHIKKHFKNSNHLRQLRSCSSSPEKEISYKSPPWIRRGRLKAGVV